MSEPPPDAAAVWRDYQRMDDTKRRHFDYLQQLENKYQRFGRPDATEQAELRERLAAHDAQVKRFKAGLNRLRIDDPPAYAELVKRLAAGE